MEAEDVDDFEEDGVDLDEVELDRDLERDDDVVDEDELRLLVFLRFSFLLGVTAAGVAAGLGVSASI